MNLDTPNHTWNREFSQVLSELADLMMKKGEVMKIIVHNRARDTIQSIDQDIKNIEQLKNTPTIGVTIYDKLDEYTKTGKVALLEKYRNDPIIVFTNIYGVGPKKAGELVKTHDIQSIEELREKQERVLNNLQRIGLKYYEDILERILAMKSQNTTVNSWLFKQESKTINTYYEIVGSYRRGAINSGDIDVIVTSDDHPYFTEY